jgi:hypothetical protein
MATAAITILKSMSLSSLPSWYFLKASYKKKPEKIK